MMKPLSTLSFTVLTPLFFLLVHLANRSNDGGSVQAALLPNIPPPNLPPALLQEYYKLFDMCNNGGANAVRCLHLRAWHWLILLTRNSLDGRNGLRRRLRKGLQLQWVFPNHAQWTPPSDGGAVQGIAVFCPYVSTWNLNFCLPNRFLLLPSGTRTALGL